MIITTLTTALFVLIPNHPSELQYPEYVFTPPEAELFRETLSNGVDVFIVEDRELPLIQMRATFIGGSHLEPSDMVGLTSLAADLMRSGGTTTSTAEQVDEQLDFFAANVGARASGSTLRVTLNCLSDNFEEGFDLFLNIIQNPRFQDSRLELSRDELLEDMKQRNDYPSAILDREFNSLLYGDSYLGREPTERSVSSITKSDLANTHATIVDPENLILSVSGDFNRSEMLALLEHRLGGWEGKNKNGPPPSVRSNYVPGIYYVHQEVSQGGVNMGIRTLRQGDPDVIAAKVMNHILGGGGFTSRITRRVRSDEGLAYSAGSALSENPWDDGLWIAYFESKNQTVALAATIILEEIERIKTELVSEEELRLAKNSMIESFPSLFQSKDQALRVFVNDVVTNRDPNYWTSYRDAVNAITAEDIQRVARRLLKPREMLVVVVGDWSVIEGGDLGGRASMANVQSVIGGEIVELPMRDPMSLEITQQ